VVQTHTPNHYALRQAAAHDYEAFAEHELGARRSPPYPPHVGLVNVLVSGTDESEVGAAAVEVAQWLRRLISSRMSGGAEVVGPAPAPLARIKRRWRWHLLLRTADRRLLGRILRYAVRRAPHAGRGSIRLTFDRDPVSLL
jgi:primosomal protein N' (replication factor Y)